MSRDISDISIDLIDVDPEQPRRHFDEEKLDELAASIAANGLASAILLRPVGDRFVIVYGERRFRACRMLGWTAIPAEVRAMDANTARWLGLVENIQRADLSPIEEAQAYAAALATGLTQQQLGERIGKKQSDIAQKLRLLKMAPELQEAVNALKINEGVARQLLRLEPESHDWAAIVKQCSDKGYSVRQVKHYVDYQILGWYPQWLDGPHKFRDLLEFEKRVAADIDRGYLPQGVRLHEMVIRLIGVHLLWYAQSWGAGAIPQISPAEWPLDRLNALAEWPLDRLTAMADFAALWEQAGASYADGAYAWVVLVLFDCFSESIHGAVNVGLIETAVALYHSNLWEMAKHVEDVATEYLRNVN